MAHLWFRNEEDIWSVVPLNGHAVNVSAHPPRVLPEGFRLGEDVTAALIPAELADSPAWVLLVATDGEVRVNGFAPVAGVRVLQDRDEIRAAHCDALFFSTETQAHVEAFAGSERVVYCARCRQPIEKGQMAVRCPHPQCGVWCHQTDKLPCWTYAPACALCPQPTALDTGFAWTPEA